MRAVFQDQPDVSHVYAGSKRHMMRRLFTHEHEPFYMSAKVIEIGPIPPEPFREYLKARFDSTDRGIADSAVDGLLDITRGHPYATQELAYSLWEEVPGGFTASVDDLVHALEAVIRSEDARFTLLWEQASRAQRVLLQALAAEPGRPQSAAVPGQVRARHRVDDAAGRLRARRRRGGRPPRRRELRDRRAVPRRSGSSGAPNPPVTVTATGRAGQDAA